MSEKLHPTTRRFYKLVLQFLVLLIPIEKQGYREAERLESEVEHFFKDHTV